MLDKKELKQSSSNAVTSKATINPKLPIAVLDGLHAGVIGGWAQNADSVSIYLGEQKLASVACRIYRADLDGVLNNPNASFSYSLSIDDIEPEWLKLNTLTL